MLNLVTVTPEAKSWMAPMAESLRKFYNQVGKHLTDLELAQAIEHRFGPQITKEVCVPHNLTDGSCLLIAMAVAKEPIAA